MCRRGLVAKRAGPLRTTSAANVAIVDGEQGKALRRHARVFTCACPRSESDFGRSGSLLCACVVPGLLEYFISRPKEVSVLMSVSTEVCFAGSLCVCSLLNRLGCPTLFWMRIPVYVVMLVADVVDRDSYRR